MLEPGEIEEVKTSVLKDDLSTPSPDSSASGAEVMREERKLPPTSALKADLCAGGSRAHRKDGKSEEVEAGGGPHGWIRRRGLNLFPKEAAAGSLGSGRPGSGEALLAQPEAARARGPRSARQPRGGPGWGRGPGRTESHDVPHARVREANA